MLHACDINIYTTNVVYANVLSTNCLKKYSNENGRDNAKYYILPNFIILCCMKNDNFVKEQMFYRTSILTLQFVMIANSYMLYDYNLPSLGRTT